ncbi:MAG: hypothetical protein GX960_13065 [Actinomycetales bacterium]|nr:hypothetical protein [Actinomycetales bacterium]
MELERAVDERITAAAAAGEELPAVIGPPHPVIAARRIDRGASTSMLRSCTALAARARVELLDDGRHSVADELSAHLDTMARWESGLLDAPDPTMTVLCAAALQDLCERLPDNGSELSCRARTVLALLHDLLEAGRVGASA